MGNSLSRGEPSSKSTIATTTTSLLPFEVRVLIVEFLGFRSKAASCIALVNSDWHTSVALDGGSGEFWRSLFPVDVWYECKKEFLAASSHASSKGTAGGPSKTASIINDRAVAAHLFRQVLPELPEQRCHSANPLLGTGLPSGHFLVGILDHQISFKNRFSLEQRRQQCERVKNSHPERVPVICEPWRKNGSLPDLEDPRFLVPKDLTLHQFQMLVERRFVLRWDTVKKPKVILYIAQSMPPNDKTLEDLLSNFVDPHDGFLYIQYGVEWGGAEFEDRFFAKQQVVNAHDSTSAVAESKRTKKFSNEMEMLCHIGAKKTMSKEECRLLREVDQAAQALFHTRCVTSSGLAGVRDDDSTTSPTSLLTPVLVVAKRYVDALDNFCLFYRGVRSSRSDESGFNLEISKALATWFWTEISQTYKILEPALEGRYSTRAEVEEECARRPYRWKILLARLEVYLACWVFLIGKKRTEEEEEGKQPAAKKPNQTSAIAAKKKPDDEEAPPSSSPSSSCFSDLKQIDGWVHSLNIWSDDHFRKLILAVRNEAERLVEVADDDGETDAQHQYDIFGSKETFDTIIEGLDFLEYELEQSGDRFLR